MEILHSKYVFAPADKAANNVIIIWKRYYVDVLKEELNSTSTYYVPVQLTKDKRLLRHIDTLTKSNIDKLDLRALDNTTVVVSGRVGVPLSGLTTPVGWLSLPQLTVLSRSAIVV